jgi:RNA polymerase-binding transcription factor DksA
MGKKKMCEICGKNPAEVPDRERKGRPINRLCLECHTKRLKTDMAQSLFMQKKRREQPNGMA